METYPSPLSSKKTPEPPHKHSQVSHGPSGSVPGFVNNIGINDTLTQQSPYHCIVGTLL